MTDTVEDEFVVERFSPEDAFELVADETRVRILDALSAAESPLSFSDLRDRAAVDDPGRFNYHLGKLTGSYVRESPEGYELGVAGRRVVGAVLSGGFTRSFDGTSAETDSACPLCGTAMRVELDGDVVDFACPTCDLTLYRAAVPPGAFAGRDVEAIPRVIDRYQKRRAFGSALGFCSFCDGPLDHEIRLETVPGSSDGQDATGASQTTDAPDGPVASDTTDATDAAEANGGSGDEVVARHTTCERCGVETQSAVEAALLGVPEVIGFHADHGIDLLSTPLWELPWLFASGATVEREDPRRIRVPVALDDETLLVTLDDDLEVVETRRT